MSRLWIPRLRPERKLKAPVGVEIPPTTEEILERKLGLAPGVKRLRHLLDSVLDGERDEKSERPRPLRNLRLVVNNA